MTMLPWKQEISAVKIYGPKAKPSLQTKKKTKQTNKKQQQTNKQKQQQKTNKQKRTF